MEKLTKQQRKERAKNKIEAYNRILWVRFMSRFKAHKLFHGVRESILVGIESVEQRANELAKVNPQEKNLIEQAVYNFDEKLKQIIKESKEPAL